LREQKEKTIAESHSQEESKDKYVHVRKRKQL
jgi:hypothetical protein